MAESDRVRVKRQMQPAIALQSTPCYAIPQGLLKQGDRQQEHLVPHPRHRMSGQPDDRAGSLAARTHHLRLQLQTPPGTPSRTMKELLAKLTLVNGKKNAEYASEIEIPLAEVN